MKTFLLSIPNSIRNWSNSLDAKTVLCSRSWLVFNDEGVKESYIFQKDGTLIASHNGKVTRAKWEYLAVNGSLLIENPSDATYLLKPAYYDEKVLALQVDGTESVALMIEEQHAVELALESVERANLYITNRTEFDNQQRERKEAEDAKEKARVEAWEKFIDKKVEERMSNPEIQAERQKLEKKIKRYKYSLVILFIAIIISLILMFQQDLPDLRGFGWIVFIVSVLVLSHIVVSLGDLEIYIQNVKLEIKKEYPLEDFQIEQ